ncbi:hypothetical protein AXF42_Ash010273 [Apostasia shenzhenica]|uniref:Stress-response A/B barrel domain-containing protein n=1 Tax=Apostasia shenzhenica TaxID=1088818 RepID=A0A2I0AA19_9ASPA|nr:hypothetical protein AXF42_Ash010273 [Apostasia shenzhenica]
MAKSSSHRSPASAEEMPSLRTFHHLHRWFFPAKSIVPSSPSSSSLQLRRRSPPPLALSAASSPSSSGTKMPLISTVEHVVLFKVRDSTDPSKIDAMMANLRALISLDVVSHLTAGPILRCRSAAAEAAGFSHLLHSRYRSEVDLASYASHPAHQAVVQENVLPICDDVMAVDWIADLDAPVVPPPGSVVRLTLAKPREGTAAEEIVRAIDGVRVSVPANVQLSIGKNFSARAKGYEVGFISVFPGLDELDAVEGNDLEEQKVKLRPLVESVIVVDFEVASPSSSL